MNKIIKTFAIIFTLCLTLGMTAINVDAKDYDYTITILAGAKGTINGAEKVTLNQKYGDYINLYEYAGKAAITDEKYFIRGVRESGRDEIMPQGAVMVSKDMDYVIAYGIKDNLVSYTVQYLDEEGNELAPADVFYGNVGEKPIVSYLYFENYQPQAYSLTKTLSENESENVFPFEYKLIVGETKTEFNEEIIDKGTIVSPGETIITATGGQATAGGAEEAAPVDATTDAQETDATNADNANVAAEDIEAPLQTMDLDDVETPAANMELENANNTLKLNYILLGTIGAALLVALFAIFLIKRKKDTQEEKVKNEK